jgi:hypothetical protein
MKASAQIPKVIIDQNAESITDMMKETPHSRSWISTFASDMVKSGKWERVGKRQGDKVVPAYRVKR